MPRHDTERLVLEPLNADDATVDFLFGLNSDPEVMRYLTGGKPSTRTEVIMAARAAVAHRWIVHLRGSGETIGWAGIRPGRDDARNRELGYRFIRTAWGHGYATEASRSLIAHAFHTLDAHRVWAGTMAVNTRSRRVMESCGMTLYRTFFAAYDDPIEGSEHGDVEYELSLADWRKVVE